MRHFIFALAIMTPVFAHAQTAGNLANLTWSGAAAPIETMSALLPVPGELTAADLVAQLSPLGVTHHSVDVASTAVSTSEMTGADLARLRGRTIRTPIVIIQDTKLADAIAPRLYR